MLARKGTLSSGVGRVYPIQSFFLRHRWW